MKNEIIQTMPFILQIPEPDFRTEELGDSSVNIHVYVWHPRDDWSKLSLFFLILLNVHLINLELKSLSLKE